MVHDIPAGRFPLTIRLWAAGADVAGPPTWQATVTGPGGVQIPGLGPGTVTRVDYADGSCTVVPPGGL